MNSRNLTNLRLIENITVQVPNTVLVRKSLLFHVFNFLEKIIIQLRFEIIKLKLQVLWQTIPNYWCQMRQIFLTRTRVS